LDALKKKKRNVGGEACKEHGTQKIREKLMKARKRKAQDVGVTKRTSLLGRGKRGGHKIKKKSA